ncbi:2-phosphosulfolactate phosphatase [Rhodococcus triatomae]|uniref:Probable 2-phosphosulfolactate phosphatase n=1 Tax=Rhodococcus triatomae TaxID=300028 RepID=A0A1G8CPX9_9NOCA|nr:2-phosphosulfolactate phosphatase [Rhodococcus triatomae]QNG18611.1 2-phosphosulfolactate phosphatase [Rhodococcus triatomae]QNG21720.1 2-phosphosulfolactate phosphatase [Rhodococcus triatomae]SDH46930.1 2-phosphosulfolactate phosphatase [Rhodococcus triatomae]
MNEAHRQGEYRIRFDWGLVGAEAVAPGVDVAVVVDVLSFSTTVSVALDIGTEVIPYRWDDGGAADAARRAGAALAVGRSQAGDDGISLSPGTLRSASPSPKRLVLPSPNGSTIAAALADRAGHCVAACLRNAPAVAEWIAHHAPGATVAVVAAGERWPDGALRPAVEDLWGAGYVLDRLGAGEASSGSSPEARAAVAAWRAITTDVPDTLRDCASGRELIAAGYTGDVEIAAEAAASRSVPLLHDGVFVCGE